MAKKDKRIRIEGVPLDDPFKIGRMIRDRVDEIIREDHDDVVSENERLKQIIEDFQRVQNDFQRMQREHQEKITDMQERINGYLEEIRIYEHEHRTLRQIIIDAIRGE